MKQLYTSAAWAQLREAAAWWSKTVGCFCAVISHYVFNQSVGMHMLKCMPLRLVNNHGFYCMQMPPLYSHVRGLQPQTDVWEEQKKSSLHSCPCNFPASFGCGDATATTAAFTMPSPGSYCCLCSQFISHTDQKVPGSLKESQVAHNGYTLPVQ